MARARTVPGTDRSVRVVRITSSGAPLRADLQEIWEFRQLFWFLAWRDVAVRYKQTTIGVAWALVQPLSVMGVFTLVFGRLAHLPSAGKPYALFTLAALVPWGFFASGMGTVSNSLVANSALLRRAYFPRLIVPVSSLGVASVDFCVALLLLLVLAGLGGEPLSVRLLILVPSFVLLGVFTLGLGLGFAILNAMYRDFRHVVSLLVQLMLFATPVAYSSELVPSRWHWLLALNPLVAVVEGFRAAFLGTAPPTLETVAWSMLTTSVAVVLGLSLFRRLELVLVDVV